MLRISARSPLSSVTSGFAVRSIASSADRSAPLLSNSSSSSGLKEAARHKDEQPLRMLMLAKPGSGKGTLSGALMDEYDVKFLSTGDILREHIKQKTDIGSAAEAIVADGGLMPDELMLQLIVTNLQSMKGKNWILDGFPRTMGQGELLDRYLEGASSPLGLVVHLDVPDDIIMSRITERWIHPGSGRIYNYTYNKPQVPGRDDVTGEPLVQRPDDKPEVYARRLKAFYDKTAPLLAYYKSRSPTKLVSLAGESSGEIWPKLDAEVQSRFRLKPKVPTKRLVPDAIIRQAGQEAGCQKDYAKA